MEHLSFEVTFNYKKIDLFYFSYQGLLTVGGVFCRTPNQALPNPMDNIFLVLCSEIMGNHK